MTSLSGQFARRFSYWLVVTLALVLAPTGIFAAPHASIVIDARSGEVLHEENADARLHPASLTKMMTLYITFQELERGSISLDSMVTVTKHAASQPPSRLGLKPGQKIAVRYLIRAAAIKSANDAAAALGDFIGGNQDDFARRMTRTAKALGMTNTTFKNANGLTAPGHLSSARDMNNLGRHLFYDFPQYYNIFSRRSSDAGIATVNNTNRRFLDAYKGADGIKTGYTVAAGFNLTASAERDGKRLIATIFGATSTPNRNAEMTKLLNKAFEKARKNAPFNPPDAPGATDALVAQADTALPEVEGGAGKTLRVTTGMATSPRPQARPAAPAPETLTAAAEAVDEMQDGILGALAEATGTDLLAEQASEVADATVPAAALAVEGVELASAETGEALPSEDALTEAVANLPADALPAVDTAAVTPEELPFQIASAAAAVAPPKRRTPIYDDAATGPAPAEQQEVVSFSTSGDRHWAITVGRYNSSYEAEKALLKMQLVESATLNASLPKVMQKSGGFEATFVGLTQDQADLACRRLQARSVTCFTIGE
ncbi:D-alanyl-D-alanine carboxypeptidase [Gemmobacter aquarius]|uniref:D-alanyl-D-alanine carboxypeptidase n=1 Tax=Paragemmobacter aquarius TaxID=2169400 RepID=A0A2S0UP29_9RHOB|nr:D-alanyl-D-alanine carboxypeptidase family protein [Gemmobacter aquarius]AWB49569.1 D-alanyl-D-alanine carboxypeptidase [Gemmobacter aquarius]